MSRLIGLRLRSSGRMICMCCGSDEPVVEAVAAGGRLMSDMDDVRTCICPDCFNKIALKYPCLGVGGLGSPSGLRS